MLKRWCYAGVYGPQVMLCAGVARIGPAPQAWWAVWDRQASRLTQRTRLLVGLDAVRVTPGEVSVADGDVEIRLTLDADAGVEVYTPDPGGYVWTRKHEAHARGHVRVGERSLGGGRAGAGGRQRGLPPPPHRVALVGGQRSPGGRRRGDLEPGRGHPRLAPRQRAHAMGGR